jgi:hypothetical protein
VKILGNVKKTTCYGTLQQFDVFNILIPTPSIVDGNRNFFYQNDQQKTLYKMRYVRKLFNTFFNG